MAVDEGPAPAAGGPVIKGTVKLPFLGTVKKQTAVLLGFVAAGVAGFALYRHHIATSGGAAAGSSAATDQTAAGDGSGTFADPGAIDTLGGNTDLGGATSGDGTGTISTPPAPAGFTTNAQWAQAAEAYLTGTVGGDPNVVAAALGKYITGQAVTDAQEDPINQAITFQGYPPISGAGGYPPSIRKAGSGGGTGTPLAANPVGGLHVARTGFTSVDLAWTGTPHAKDYLVTVLQNGQQVRQSKTGNTRFRAGGLKEKTHYQFRVRAQPGATGARDAEVMATTR